MKVDYLIEFLPQELRRQSVIAATRRRSALLVGLLTMLSVGVAAHSWNLYRRADIERQITLQVCTNAVKVDDVIDRLAADQQRITRFLGVYDRVALPLETSDLIATITHLMPEKMSLAMVKLDVEAVKPAPGTDTGAGTPAPKPKPAPVKQKGSTKAPPAKAAADKAPAGKGGTKAPAKGAAGGRTAKGADASDTPASPPTRWLLVTIRGFTSGNADLYEFERRLNRTTPLEEVTVIGNKPIDVPGAKLQEFTITCRIPLNHRYERQVGLATEPPSHEGAEPADADEAEHAAPVADDSTGAAPGATSNGDQP